MGMIKKLASRIGGAFVDQLAKNSYIQQRVVERFSTMPFQEWMASYASFKDQENDEARESGVNTKRPLAKSVWVYCACQAVADSLSSVPWYISRPKSKQRNDSGPLFELTQRPNPDQEWSEFVVESMLSLLTDGMIFWVPEFGKGSRGRQVESIRVRHRSEFTPITDYDDRGREIAVAWELGGPTKGKSDNRYVPGVNIFPWGLTNPYSYYEGLSPLGAAGYSLYVELSSGIFSKAFFESGGQPGLVFSTENEEFTNERAQEAQAWFEAKHGGAKRAFRPLFLGHGLIPRTVAINAKEAELVALRAMSRSEILGIYRVPEIIVGSSRPAGGVSIGGSNRKPEQENFWLHTVRGWARSFSSRWNRIVSAGYGAERLEFDFDQIPVLQDRRLDRAREARAWIEYGATYNDVVDKFGVSLDEQPTGNEWWVPSNMVPASFILKAGPSILTRNTENGTSQGSRGGGGASRRGGKQVGNSVSRETPFSLDDLDVTGDMGELNDMDDFDDISPASQRLASILARAESLSRNGSAGRNGQEN